ncbi:MAG: glycosyltransferase family 4 protein [Bacteroidales bacterium]|nr:glycosyltransferase family 4 protein [Bacteroidales bacterium]
MTSICHITTAHTRYDVRIFHKECKSLTKVFEQVNLIVADGLGDEIKDGINIYDIGKPKGRTDRFLKMPGKALTKALEIKSNIYHLHDSELLRIALKLKKRGYKVIYDSHEDLPRQIISKPYIPKILRSPLAAIVEKYENRIAKRLNGIVTATPFIRDRFIKLNKNCTDINNFPLLSEIIGDNSIAAKENKICYIGGITQIRGLTEVIESLELTDTRLDLAGDMTNDYKTKLESLDGWKNVNYLGFIDRKQSQNIKNSSIAGIVTFLPEPNHINAQPNKIFEYMASGLPVIGSNFPLWKIIIEDNYCGLCVDPTKPQEISNAINYLAENPNEAKIMGENGKRLVKEKYNWEIEEKKLIEFYKALKTTNQK